MDTIKQTQRIIVGLAAASLVRGMLAAMYTYWHGVCHYCRPTAGRVSLPLLQGAWCVTLRMGMGVP